MSYDCALALLIATAALNALPEPIAEPAPELFRTRSCWFMPSPEPNELPDTVGYALPFAITPYFTRSIVFPETATATAFTPSATLDSR